MANEIINKSFQPNKKDIKYLSKDFNQFKQQMVEFSKTYFPQTYKDFNQTSPGMMFIEMASYIGDVLSFYIDYQFKESLMTYAEERKNLLALSRYLGYKVRTSTPAVTKLEVFQILPSKQGSDGNMEPDFNYAATIQEGMEVSSVSGVIFRTMSPINFSIDTQDSPRETTVYQRDQSGQPQFFLLRKITTATAGSIISKDFYVGTPDQFYKIQLPEQNVLEIVDVVDSDNNKWYEVPYLAQDLILNDTENIALYDSKFSRYNDIVPSIMKSLRTSRRFITLIDPNNYTYLEFGPGLEAFDDELIIPNLNTVGRDLNIHHKEGVSYDPSNFLKSRTYGQSPANTTLTVRYIVGGGISSNVNTNELVNISQIEFGGDINDYSVDEQSLVNTVRRSVTVNNYIPATGGKDAETEEEIRQNALANFSSQNRTVTKEDYIVRVMSMPAKYGAIAKAYVVQDGSLDYFTQRSLVGGNEQSTVNMNVNELNVTNPFGFNAVYAEKNNPFAINLYILCYDKDKHLTQSNEVVVNNLRTYLNQNRILTDGVNILDGFIINIGVDFEIITYKDVSKKETLANAITAAANFFNIDNWNFSQPISISALELEIAKSEGVQSVASLRIKNLTINDGNYSSYEYDIEHATSNKIVYPSLDPSIFECKWPTKDIVGRCL